jgi:AcrR family transcriptional regulator
MKKETKKSAEKKNQILHAALDLFLKKGYYGTSTSEICLLTGINKASLYYYFESKKDLFLSLHTNSIDTLLKPYLKEASAIEDPKLRFEYMIEQYTRMVCRYPELGVLIHGSLTADEDFETIRKEWKKHYLLLRETIKELQRKKEVNLDLNCSYSALMLLGMVTWITFWFKFDHSDRMDQIAECALTLARGMMRGSALGPVAGRRSGNRNHPPRKRSQSTSLKRGRLKRS